VWFDRFWEVEGQCLCTLSFPAAAERTVRQQSAGQKGQAVMLLIGVILLVIGFVTGISILWTIGIILVVIGAILWILGSMGHAVGGRRHYW
jgi:fatty-acid desaturase